MNLVNIETISFLYVLLKRIYKLENNGTHGKVISIQINQDFTFINTLKPLEPFSFPSVTTFSVNIKRG